MKKIFILLFSILYSFCLTGQEDKSPFEYGAKFGLSISELQGSENLKSLRSSFSVGLISEYKLSNRYAILAELNYSRQGSTDRGNEQGAFFERRINLDYFNFPVLGKYYLKKGFAFELGPQLGFLTNAEFQSKQVNNSITRDVKDDFENFDISVLAGISYKTEWGFLIGLRYGLGLNDINDGTDLESGSLKNAVFQLQLGYLLK